MSNASLLIVLMVLSGFAQSRLVQSLQQQFGLLRSQSSIVSRSHLQDKYPCDQVADERIKSFLNRAQADYQINTQTSAPFECFHQMNKGGPYAIGGYNLEVFVLKIFNGEKCVTIELKWFKDPNEITVKAKPTACF